LKGAQVGCFFWQHKETTIEWVGAALQQLNDWGDMLFHGWWPCDKKIDDRWQKINKK
jgi:hypothetical protein